MKSLTAVTLVIVLTSGFVSAQKKEFEDLWSRYQKGEDIRHELRVLSNKKQAQPKVVFNSCYLLAVIDLATNEPDSALKFLERAEKAKSDKPQVAVRRAEALMLKDKFEEAEAELKKARSSIGRRKSPIQLRHQIVKARLEGRRGRTTKAVKRLKGLTRRYRKNWEAHFFLGHMYERLDDPKGAIDNYEKTIKYLPQSDPCLGIYAYQRWAALKVSSDGGSYGNPKLLQQAVDYYEKFLKRAAKNKVPKKLTDNVRSTISTLKYFMKKK